MAKSNEELVEQFESIKKRRDKVKTEKIQTETVLESLEEERDKLLKELKDKFEVDDLEEAEKLRKEMKEELENQLDDIEDKMQEYEEAVDDELFEDL